MSSTLICTGKFDPVLCQLDVTSCSLPTRGKNENLSGSLPSASVPILPLARAVIALIRSTKSSVHFTPNPLMFLSWPIAILSTIPPTEANNSAIDPFLIVGKIGLMSPDKGTVKDPNETFQV